MQFRTFLASGVMLCLTQAAPTPEPAEQGTAVLVTMTAYADSNYGGPSVGLTVNTQSQCYGLSGSDWTNRISSIKVPSGYRCRLWDSNSCDGQSSPDIYPPGASEIGGMNDKATSFKCYKN